MDGIANTVGYAGYAVAVVSAIFAYVNRDRYKTLVKDIYEPGNQELRQQLSTARSEIAEISNDNITLKATAKEKDSYIKHLEELATRLPDITALNQKSNEVIKLMSNNHKAVLESLTDLAKAINERKKPKK